MFVEAIPCVETHLVGHAFAVAVADVLGVDDRRQLDVSSVPFCLKTVDKVVAYFPCQFL